MTKLTQAERYHIALITLIECVANAARKQHPHDSEGSYKEVLRDVHGDLGRIIDTL